MKLLNIQYKQIFKTVYFQQKIKNALNIIENAFKKGNFYIAFSGGKDSTVVLDLVRTIDNSVIGIWGDDEFFLPETKQYIDSIHNVHRASLRIKHTEWFTANEDAEFDSINKYTQNMNLNGCFLGLRADENGYRKIFLRKYGMLFWAKKRQQWICNPIAWWTLNDVWTYILGKEISYNKAYDKLEKMGCPEKMRRIGPIVTEKAAQYGQIIWLKKGWPDLFNEFAKKYPEIRRYL